MRFQQQFQKSPSQTTTATASAASPPSTCINSSLDNVYNFEYFMDITKIKHSGQAGN